MQGSGSGSGSAFVSATSMSTGTSTLSPFRGSYLIPSVRRMFASIAGLLVTAVSHIFHRCDLPPAECACCSDHYNGIVRVPPCKLPPSPLLSGSQLGAELDRLRPFCHVICICKYPLPDLSIPAGEVKLLFVDHDTYEQHDCDFLTDLDIWKVPPALSDPLYFMAIRNKEIMSRGWASASASCCAREVLTTMRLIFDIKKDVVMVVGADPDGKLTRHLLIDVYYMCRVIGISAVDAQGILDQLSAKVRFDAFTVLHSICLDSSQKPVVVRIRVLWNPSVDDLIDVLPNVIKECNGFEVSLIYCGHANKFGSIQLLGGELGVTELKDLLESCSLQGGSPRLILNCCFAIEICNFLSPTPMDVSKVEGLVDVYMQDLGHFERTDDEDRFASLFMYLIKRVGGHAGLGAFNMGSTEVNILPFSRTEMRAEGALRRVFGLHSEQPSIDVTSILTRSKPAYSFWDTSTKLVRAMTHDPDSTPANVIPSVSGDQICVRVFQAAHGDSCLVQSLSASVLIDGGPATGDGSQVCFWPCVSHLPKLDLVLLTHGDTDHVNGLLSMMYYKAYEPAALPAITTLVLLANGEEGSSSTFPPKATGVRDWRESNTLAEVAEAARVQVIRDPKKSNKYEVTGLGKFHVIMPDSMPDSLDKKNDYTDAMTELKKPANKSKSMSRLTTINRTGVVTVLEADSGQLLLFTGDADGDKIRKALAESDWRDRVFDYVDMPHHGSADNHPSEFLNGLKGEYGALKALNIVVSSNGATYGNPSRVAIDALKTYLENQNAGARTLVHFNYRAHKYKKINARKLEENALEVVHRFPSNLHSCLRYPTNDDVGFIDVVLEPDVHVVWLQSMANLADMNL